MWCMRQSRVSQGVSSQEAPAMFLLAKEALLGGCKVLEVLHKEAVGAERGYKEVSCC